MPEKPTSLSQISSKKYVDQAKWFLNGFWKDGIEQEAENVWNFANKFIELDTKKKEGNELDEFWSHKFLESQGETLSVVDLRNKLKKIDVDMNKRMSLIEYLLFKYEKGIKECLESPQEDNQKEIEEAAAKLQAVQDALAEVQVQLDAQTKALAEQRKAEEEARASLHTSTNAAIKAKNDAHVALKAEGEAKIQLVNQKKAEEIVKAAEAELKAAVDDLKSQEDSYHNAVKALEVKSTDESIGQVQRNKAANELAQLKGQDPLPLRKAKLTQGAALKKVEKERKGAEEVTAKAVSSHEAAEKSARTSEQSAAAAEEAKQVAEHSAAEAARKREEKEEQAKRVEAAVRDTEARFVEAQEFLEAQKAKGGVAFGSIWWLERELKEAQKYLPKRKQAPVK